MELIYPVLIAEIAKKGIKKKAIANKLGISNKAFYNKLNGKTPFTWPEAITICHSFFPEMTPEVLFAEGSKKSKEVRKKDE